MNGHSNRTLRFPMAIELNFRTTEDSGGEGIKGGLRHPTPQRSPAPHFSLTPPSPLILPTRALWSCVVSRRLRLICHVEICPDDTNSSDAIWIFHRSITQAPDQAT